MSFIWGLAGCLVITLLSFLLSEKKKSINIRTVSIGFILQVIFGYIVLKWEFGKDTLAYVSTAINDIIDYGHEGIAFVFGPLADRGGDVAVFAVNVLGMIIFLTVLIALLYHFGIMQYMVRFIGGFISKIMKTSYAESAAAAANIFVGNTQAPLVVKPYIANMTRSQLFSVMVGGLASVSGAIMISLAAMGIPLEYLLSAAIMSAPAGIMIAKVIIPESEEINENEWKETVLASSEEKTNIIDVIFTSSKEGLHFAVNVGLMLIAFIGLIALINGILGWGGSLFGFENFSLELILGYLFAPIAFVIGIPWDEALVAGNLLAQKLLLNEFVAFAQLSTMVDSLSDRALAVLTFALSGFANFGAAGSIVGMLSNMVPQRKTEIQKLMLKALIAATFANLLNGAIVSMFF
ncbi:MULTISPECIES: nucleoside transporter C-terminal domain-containing protein [Oceanobacillus]|uniref:Transporter YutK n=1 Tax=Oceanobacillus kimchii TaxID=746691 RepID=A0ABQ5TLU3_9BACI|nr:MULTISPECIES: nucleoside transporter C-terminal domain-containing protein [Oceanobacillus]MBT2600395.1 NupC/NupG family nucleoside CNT transporter [Oceanobacillus sp. ISL-74]MBT2650553.1 NupC/NupG family nucleoside CNT transporter [Oceanobacillus sp. ISL-73]MCT1578294.1 NupC/NupG family nucleoside CNT transporter [Oceanobacillus kimchii]MCT2134472.1 NupC/NupG family nucleoside CNT transporter [Oceanobacillus kimchii]OEH54904.1 transporter [Oceanobacillus sp. E9]